MSSSYYSFFPYLRRGLAGLITDVDETTTSSSRASIPFDINIKRTKHDDSSNVATATRSVEIVGPGDITGINGKAIIRHSPVESDKTFEPNYLPFVEFYDEDFPWRYTPAKPKVSSSNYKLRPWLTLAVLKTGSVEFEFGDFQGTLPTIVVKNPSSSMPPINTLWATGHVQVNKDLGTSGATAALSSFEGIVASDPDRAMSRVISPRKLEANTRYHAFLVPTFEVGRLAGLGQEIASNLDRLKCAWDGAGGDLTLPYYYNWQFETTDATDFESLVDALETRALGSSAVRREMDIQKPGNALINGQSDSPTVNVYGALKSTDGEESADFWNPYDDTNKFNKELRKILNLAEDYKVANPTGDPIITPPIYGKWAALKKSLLEPDNDGGTPNPAPNDPAHWVDELNLDPALRVIAGLGADLVREKQEDFMDQCWKQVGEVMEANRKLKSGEMAEEVSRFIYNKSVVAENDEQLLSITHNLHSRLNVSGASISKIVNDSRVPNACFSGAFRKLTARNGFLSKKLDANGEAFVDASSKDEDIILAFNTSLTTGPDYKSPSALAEYEIIPERNRNSAYVSTIDSRPNFYPTKPGAASVIPPGSGGSDSSQAADYRTALFDQHSIFETQIPGPAPWKPMLSISTTSADVKNLIKPETSIRDAVTRKVGVSGVNPSSIKPIMAAPKIKTPMYKELINLSMDGFMPNMKESIPPNTITLLESNQKFIESFFVGMNHEIARELLWREYPTDQRGTVFQQFWSSETIGLTNTPSAHLDEKNLRSIKEIHTWDASGLSQLGTNNPTGAPIGNLVLALRSDLLRKYPNLSIFAQKAKWDSGKRVFDSSAADYNELRYPIYSAKAEPDITFMGFDLTDTQAKGDLTDAGWFFVFKERAGDIRFGLDFATGSTPSTIASWNDMHWGYMGGNFLDFTASVSSTSESTIGLNSHAADVAYILEQKPVIIGVHASDMLPE